MAESKWVTGNWGYFTLLMGVISLLKTGRGPPCNIEYIIKKYTSYMGVHESSIFSCSTWAPSERPHITWMREKWMKSTNS